MAPFDHKYEVEAGADNVTEPPEQNVVGPPAVMVGTAGSALTVTVVAVLEALRHPEAFVTCTVYVPAVVTLIDGVVAPFDHK